MKDIKEFTVPDMVYVEKFDINVRPYLAVGEIEAIGNEMLSCPNILLQKLSLMLNVLNICTDIPKEYIMMNQDGEDDEKFLGFDLIIQSGLWESVCEVLEDDIEQVWEYVADGENMEKAIANFVREDLTYAVDQMVNILEKWEKKMPRGKQWNEIMTALPNNLKDILTTIKEDGNAEIINNAMKMNSVVSEDASNS